MKNETQTTAASKTIVIVAMKKAQDKLGTKGYVKASTGFIDRKKFTGGSYSWRVELTDIREGGLPVDVRFVHYEIGGFEPVKLWARISLIDGKLAFADFDGNAITPPDWVLAQAILGDHEVHEPVEAEAEEPQSEPEHTMTLIVDATPKRYCVCSHDGTPVWFGNFFAEDRVTDEFRGELEAAKKAIWLASKAKDELCLPSLKVIIKTDSTRVAQTALGDLRESARRNHIDAVEAVIIPGAENPADKNTRGKGFLRWSDFNLNQLFTKADLAAMR
ncbi:hypothetical protein [Cerasicoccus frondis]|uniref:hypothetical protein n=1 Tax=Cerasicoccus frondis TaxID=490090 RepID=UPI00285259CB|nr:hypothetical protein [Cerasicoccus frondis]